MMDMTLAIVLIVIALIGGLIGGFFLARKYMLDYFEKNPPINEDTLRMLMIQMGQKPSERKIKQMASAMKQQQKKALKK